jgi:WD40 repeat protein
MSGHTDLVGSVVFSPDDTRILTSSSDQTARIWDASTGRPLQVLRGHTGQLWSAEFSPDGRRVLTASSDHTARLWDAASGVETERLVGLSDNVSSAAFSPDGERVVTSLDDQTARIWDLAGGRQILALVGHTDALEFAAFAPDGSHIVTASDDATARIWDVRTPALGVQLAWAGAAQFDSLSSTQRYELGLPPPADVRAWSQAHTPCDEASGAPEDPDRVTPGVRSAELVADVAMAACARVTRDAPNDARSHFEYARALMAGGQLPAARAELEQAAARGYRAAQIQLAALLAQQSSGSDAARATALDEKAWNAGDALAAFELGAMYEHREYPNEPIGTDAHASNKVLAWQWYRRGADALEPHAVARLAERDEEAAATAASGSERDRLWLEAFRHYAAAAETARREDWPDGAWRIWRFRRASLARLLALDGQMPEVASAFDAVRERR